MQNPSDTCCRLVRPSDFGAGWTPRLMVAAALCSGLAAAGYGRAADAGQPPFPLGVYAGNPDGNDPSAEADFETRFNSFVATMGATPQTMNAFVEYSDDVSTWGSNAAWVAWSWTQSPVVGTAITPVVGIPMSDNSHWYGYSGSWSNDSFFKSIISGAYDSDYQGIVDGWANAGFSTMYLRLGYEMDGQFMPWYMGDDSGTQSDWVAAFRHLATLMRNRATADGATAYIVWNPDDIGWTALSVNAAYPGDGYVDVISSDAYSPLYPSTLYDWSIGNWTFDSTIQQWWSHPKDMRHYWTWPSSTPWNPRGTGSGWGFANTIAFAEAHGKGLAVSESGAGGDGVTDGPVDNPVFPQWLAAELKQAQNAGIWIAYVNIWDTWESDGDWAFSEPGDGKPLEAASWANALGAN